MSFGLSVGDFLAAAKFIKDIVVCLKDSGGAASEYQELMDELYSLQLALNKIEHLQGNSEQAEAINSIKVAVLSCSSVLQNFSKKLESYSSSLERGETRGWIKDSSKKIKWELAMRVDVQNLRAYLQAHTSSINMRLSLEGLKTTYELAERTAENQAILEQKVNNAQVTIREVQSGVTNIEQQHAEEKRRKILDWLSSDTMQEKQDDNLSRSQMGTGEWLLKHNTFTNWMEGIDAQSTIWCPGNPGTGKTIMTSIVIDYLQKRYPSEDIGISYVYCDYKEGRSASYLIATLARQLASRKRTLPSHVLELYESLGKYNKHLDESQLRSLLLSLCNCFKQDFVLIDALDECNDGTERASILSIINELQEASVKIFVTSRPNLDDIKTYFSQVSQVEIVASENDIRTYLREKLTANSTFMKRIKSSSGLDERIIDTVANRAAGMFLMAVLQLDRIWAERTPTKITMALQSLPSKLEDTYKETLVRIQNQPESDGVLGMKILQWISCAKRPLHLDELRHALAVEWGEDESPPKELDEGNLLNPEDILDVCAGLVVIENESKIIRLVHFTTQEFFLKPESIFTDAEVQISKTCIAYISFDSFCRQACDSDSEFRARLDQFPFLIYAGKYWAIHLRGNPERLLENLVLDFLNQGPPGLNGLSQLMHKVGYDSILPGPYFPSRMTGLHFASAFGLRTIAEKLICDKNFETDMKNSRGQTPLSKAAEHGQDELVKLHLQTGADVNAKDVEGQGPLAWAVTNQHLAMARTLIEAGAEINCRYNFDMTPFRHAIRTGQKNMVKLLLDSGAKLDAADSTGQSALAEAAGRGLADIVELLLDRGAEIDLQDKAGGTALFRAAYIGHDRVVELLLDRGAKIDLQDKAGKTALLGAASWGYSHVVELLLDRGAKVDLQDEDCWTALFHAAYYGHDRVVELLLDRGAKADVKDLAGKTALFDATYYCDDRVRELLLDGGAELDLFDRSGKIPLSQEIVRMERYSEKQLRYKLARSIQKEDLREGN